jgi:hypothetical protein
MKFRFLVGTLIMGCTYQKLVLFVTARSGSPRLYCQPSAAEWKKRVFLAIAPGGCM